MQFDYRPYSTILLCGLLRQIFAVSVISARFNLVLAKVFSSLFAHGTPPETNSISLLSQHPRPSGPKGSFPSCPPPRTALSKSFASQTSSIAKEQLRPGLDPAGLLQNGSRVESLLEVEGGDSIPPLGVPGQIEEWSLGHRQRKLGRGTAAEGEEESHPSGTHSKSEVMVE